jgi:ribosomal protein S18 acetylase RimI-like enzyme
MTATERHSLHLEVEIVFRFAEREDLPRLEWYGEYTHFRRVFQRTFEDQVAGYRLMLLATVNDWPIGQVFIQLESYEDIFADMRKRGYLYSLRVMDAFRHMGIGSALLREAETILIDRRYDSVSIAAAKDNPGARRLYERMGYRVQAEDAGRWHYVDHEGKTRYVVEPCWILEKQLK